MDKEDNIRFLNSDRKIYDKKAIAEALANSCNEDELICGFIENGIIDCCKNCQVKDICMGLDNIVKQHKKATTEIVTTFNF